jgi:hypothetical protein
MRSSSNAALALGALAQRISRSSRDPCVAAEDCVQTNRLSSQCCERLAEEGGEGAGPELRPHDLVATFEHDRELLIDLGFPEIAVYPDSRKVGLLGGQSSVDASGAPLVQVSPYAQTLGYYDGEDE